MKAVVYTKYGPPDVLRVEDVEKPVRGIASAWWNFRPHR